MSGTFVYSNPTSISWGAGSLSTLAERMEQLDAHRVLLVSTRPVVENAALWEAFRAALPSEPVAVSLIGQHAPVEDVRRAVAARSESGADIVVSLGGGSPIDAAKVVARGAFSEGADPDRLPHIAVPTTLSVAELSWRAGFTNAAGNKAGFADRGMLATAVIYEPLLAVFTPVSLWLSTGVRALDHAVEGYLAAGEHVLSDALAIEAVARLFDSLPRTLEDPADPGVRGDAQVAAWFSYTLPAESMAGLGHKMGKQIGARHGIPHGDTSCLLLPQVMQYSEKRDPQRMGEMARALDRRLGDHVSASDRVGALIRELELPRHIADYGIGEAELRRAADELGTPETSAGDIFAIYMASL